MNKILAALICGILIAPQAVLAQYHSDPTINQLIQMLLNQVKVLQEQLVQLQAEAKKSEPVERKQNEEGSIRLTDKAQGLHDIEDILILAEFKVTAGADTLRGDIFSADVQLYKVTSPFSDPTPVNPAEVLFRCDNKGSIRTGDATTCEIKLRNFTASGEYRYIIKNPRVRAKEGKSVTYDRVIDGEIEVR